MDIAKRIVGTWKLVYSIVTDAEGKVDYPLGEDAIGYITYSDSGIMTVQISRKARTETRDLYGIKHDYLAYFGRYEVDEEKQLVRHILEGQLFVGGHPGILERKVRFDGDRMSLVPVDENNHEILWQRVG